MLVDFGLLYFSIDVWYDLCWESDTKTFPMKKILSLSLLLLNSIFTLNAGNPTELVDGNNTFAFNLFHELKSQEAENQFFSPFSISTALAMTYAGARNETEREISRTMHFPRNEKFHSAFKMLMDGLNIGTEGKVKLNIANGLWAQQDFRFLDSYLDLVTSNYGSELKNVNFKADNDREIARKDINSWVEHKTNDKIKNLVQPGNLNSMTKLVLVNAIYFYSEWARPFEKEATDPKDFFRMSGSAVMVPFMNQTGSYNYYEDAAVKAIEIPYADNKSSMVIFLPNEKDGITEFEDSFDYKYYQIITGSFSNNSVRLSIPKFKTNARVDLGKTLSDMGMPMAFTTAADFSGMTGRRDLYISAVIHQAFINVDEKGTEAAAATAVMMVVSMAPPRSDGKIFIADHPFLFCIKDNQSGSILFMGKIMNPSAM